MKSGPHGPPSGYITRAGLGVRQRFRAGDENKSGPQVALVATSPLSFGGAQQFKDGDKIRSGPQDGRSSTSLLSFEGRHYF